jgi:hypothetical protein
MISLRFFDILSHRRKKNTKKRDYPAPDWHMLFGKPKNWMPACAGMTELTDICSP